MKSDDSKASTQVDRTSEFYDCPLRLLGSADDAAWCVLDWRNSRGLPPLRGELGVPSRRWTGRK